MATLVDPEVFPELRKPAPSREGELEEIDIAILASTMDCTQPVGAYQIVQGLQKSVYGGCMYPESCVYRKVKNLANSGYLDATEWETSRGRQTRYLPTRQAVAAVRSWVQTPAEIPIIEARNDLWLRILALSFSPPEEVLRGLMDLGDDLDDRTNRLNSLARKEKKNGAWNLKVQLEYQLEVVLIDACRRWAADATQLLRARIEEIDQNCEAGVGTGQARDASVRTGLRSRPGSL
jgi:hypothetical protein